MADARWRGVEALGQEDSQLVAGRRKGEALDSAVPRVWSSFHQPACLQTIDQPSDIGWMAPQPLRKLSHRDGARGLELLERDGLRWGELELGSGRAEVALRAIERYLEK